MNMASPEYMASLPDPKDYLGVLLEPPLPDPYGLRSLALLVYTVVLFGGGAWVLHKLGGTASNSPEADRSDLTDEEEMERFRTWAW
jgi:hypothetical protein